MLTRFQQFDKGLANRGWVYSAGDDLFRAGERRLGPEQLLSLLPDMAVGELAAYQDAMHDESLVGQVTTVYVIPAGTRVEASRDGSDFKPHTVRRQLQFTKPLLIAEGDIIFAKGDWRVQVDRTDVIVSHQEGSLGWNEFGA